MKYDIFKKCKKVFAYKINTIKLTQIIKNYKSTFCTVDDSNKISILCTEIHTHTARFTMKNFKKYAAVNKMRLIYVIQIHGNVFVLKMTEIQKVLYLVNDRRSYTQ